MDSLWHVFMNWQGNSPSRVMTVRWHSESAAELDMPATVMKNFVAKARQAASQVQYRA